MPATPSASDAEGTDAVFTEIQTWSRCHSLWQEEYIMSNGLPANDEQSRRNSEKETEDPRRNRKHGPVLLVVRTLDRSLEQYNIYSNTKDYTPEEKVSLFPMPTVFVAVCDTWLP